MTAGPEKATSKDNVHLNGPFYCTLEGGLYHGSLAWARRIAPVDRLEAVAWSR